MLVAERDYPLCVGRLSVLLDAVLQGARGRFDQAVQVSTAALAWDSAGLGGDPFASTVLHLQRAVWLDSLGEYEKADAARLWYEHTNIGVALTGEATAAEIDWAFGTYAMWLRGIRAVERENNPMACRHLQRVIDLWRDADSAYAQLRDSAQTLITNSGCSP